MKLFHAFIFILLFPAVLFALPNGKDALTRFSFTPPATNTDGSKLTDLAGYRMYCGSATGKYGTKFTQYTPAQFANLLLNKTPSAKEGVSYCAVTAFNSEGGESNFSNEIKIYMVGGVPKRLVPRSPSKLKKNV